MSSELREKAGLVYNVVEAVLLAVCLGIGSLLVSKVLSHGEMIASHTTQINVNSGRIDKIETHGSPGLDSHIAMDENRVESISLRLEKVEQAIIVLQSAPAELKAISARLESLKEGQSRIEKMMDEHLKQK